MNKQEKINYFFKRFKNDYRKEDKPDVDFLIIKNSPKTESEYIRDKYSELCKKHHLNCKN